MARAKKKTTAKKKTAAKRPATKKKKPARTKQEAESMAQERWLRFVTEYLRDLNPGQAYLRAGFNCKSIDTARVCGFRLLQKEFVQTRVQAAIKKRAAEVEIDANWVLQKLLELHTILIRFLNDGDLRAAAIANKSLELMGRHIDVRAFETRVDVTTQGQPIQPQVMIIAGQRVEF